MKKILFFIVLIPAIVKAQYDTTLVKFLRIRPEVFIDSSILRSRNYDQGPFPLFEGVWRTKNKESGRIYSIGEYSNGKAHGHYLVLSPSGSIIQSAYYNRGLLNGPMIEFWENGNLRTIGYYSKDHLEGTLRTFDSSGRLNSIVLYVDGYREGPEIRFYSSGHIKLVTEYSAGWETGVRKEYRDAVGNGLMGEFKMKNGLPVTGKFFKDGILVNNRNFDYQQLLEERDALNKSGGDYRVKELLSD